MESDDEQRRTKQLDMQVGCEAGRFQCMHETSNLFGVPPIELSYLRSNDEKAHASEYNAADI